MAVFPQRNQVFLFFISLSDTTCSQQPYASHVARESHSRPRGFTKCFIKWTSVVVAIETSDVISQNAKGQFMLSGEHGVGCVLDVANPRPCPNTSCCSQLYGMVVGREMGISNPTRSGFFSSCHLYELSV